MSVYISEFSVIIRKDTIEKKYPGGLSAFNKFCTNAPCQEDDYLKCIGFKTHTEAAEFVKELTKHDFIIQEHQKSIDIVIYDFLSGSNYECDWLGDSLMSKEILDLCPECLECWLKGTDWRDYISKRAEDAPEQRTPLEKIILFKGDITKVKVDAIVNAANTSLLGGGGVDGAIHRAGGPEILEECKKIGGCETGKAVITNAGELPSKQVIHTVGPVWQGGAKDEEELLASCYQNSLNVAVKNQVETIAFPNISTGVYGFPKERAAEIAIREVIDFLDQNKHLKFVVFVVFDDENYIYYQQILEAKKQHSK